MTSKECSTVLGVSHRQLQRYITAGFKGKKLPAVQTGHKFTVEQAAFEEWRIASGYDAPKAKDICTLTKGANPAEPSLLPGSKLAPQPAPLTPASVTDWEHIPTKPSCPGGPLTNCPSPVSGNWPSETTMRDYSRYSAQRMANDFQRGN